MVDMRIPFVCLMLLGSGAMVAGAATFQDPLRPSGYSAAQQEHARKIEQAPAWKLTAVLFSDARLVAVINGRTVRVGDILEGYRVKSIARDQVVLNKKDRTIVVQRTGTGLKKPVRIDGLNSQKGSVQ